MPHTDDTIDDATDAVSHQPTLPALELPEYHGTRPTGMKTALTGAGSRITRPHSIGDRVVLVVEAKVKSAGHEETDDGIVYVEKLKVTDLFELAADQGSRLISTVRSLYRTGEDAAKGRRSIPALGDVGYTDASGVALLPNEVAELRGDPVRAMLSPELTPAVVVYSDGERQLWPDEFPANTPRPHVGDLFSADSVDVTVDRLVHHETGEDLEDPAEDAAVVLDTVVVAPGDPLCSCGEVNLTAANADQVLRNGTIHRAIGACYNDRSGDDEPPAGLESIAAEIVRAAEATRPALSVVPPLPGEPDPYAGDLGDGVAGWEDPLPPRPLTADEQTALLLPMPDDFAFVDCTLTQLGEKIVDVDDVHRARRLLKAEQQGRGVGGTPRKRAVGMLELLIARLESQNAVG